MIVGTFIPLFAVLIMTRFYGEERNLRGALRASRGVVPFALLGGLAFTVPYFIAAQLLSPELPSIIGGLVGLGILVVSARSRFLTPTVPSRLPTSVRNHRRDEG